MSAIARAARQFDDAWAGLPPSVQQAAALAIYRAAPAMEQYQRDLAPLYDSDEIKEALWELAPVLCWKLLKWRDPVKFEKDLAEMKESAPHFAAFAKHVGVLLSGLMPGLGIPAPRPPLELEAAPPPDAEIVSK